MCTVPVAIGVGLATQMIGSGMKTMAQNKANREQAEYYKSLAAADEKQAKQVIQAADIQQKYIVTDVANQSKESRNKFKQTIGLQKTVIAGNGIAGGSRTAQDIALDSLTESHQEESLIWYNATVASDEIFRNSRFQADQLRTRAKAHRKAARNIYKSSKTDFLSNLLDTGSSLSNTIMQYNLYAGR